MVCTHIFNQKESFFPTPNCAELTAFWILLRHPWQRLLWKQCGGKRFSVEHLPSKVQATYFCPILNKTTWMLACAILPIQVISFRKKRNILSKLHLYIFVSPLMLSPLHHWREPYLLKLEPKFPSPWAFHSLDPSDSGVITHDRETGLWKTLVEPLAVPRCMYQTSDFWLKQCKHYTLSCFQWFVLMCWKLIIIS